MFKTHDVHSLTDFQRNTRKHLRSLRETGRPVVLTVNGKAEVVVQDAAAYQELLDRLEKAEVAAEIQRALSASRRGGGSFADDAMKQLGDELGLRSDPA